MALAEAAADPNVLNYKGCWQLLAVSKKSPCSKVSVLLRYTGVGRVAGQTPLHLAAHAGLNDAAAGLHT